MRARVGFFIGRVTRTPPNNSPSMQIHMFHTFGLLRRFSIKPAVLAAVVDAAAAQYG